VDAVLSRGSVLHELSHRDFPCSGETGEQVALIVNRDLFPRSDRWIGQWNERGDRAVFDAANPDTLLESGISRSTIRTRSAIEPRYSLLPPTDSKL
jgi:hypothetical protein